VGYGLLSILFRGLLCVIVPNLLLLLVFCRTKEFRYFWTLAKGMLGKVTRHGQ
jgi:hypothetical protein